MKIAFPIITASSGSDVYYRLLCSCLKKNGIDAKVLELDYRYEFIPLLHRQICKKLEKYDIIHSNGDYGHLFKVAGKPLIASLLHNVFDPYYQIHTTFPQKLYHFGLLKRRLRKSIELSNRIICISKATQKSFQDTFSIKTKKLVTIYNGIDTNFFKPPSKPTQIKKGSLVFVGNFSKRKGADLLGPVMEQLGNNYTLTCVSRSQPKQDLPQNIRFLQDVTQAELPHYYHKAQLLLFPSRLEGFGYAVAEAMACAKPVVCSNNSSLPELIDNGLGGYLCTTDDVDCFVTKIKEITGDPKKLREMGCYNRKKAEQLFSLDRMTKEYITLYEQVLTQNKSKRTRI